MENLHEQTERRIVRPRLGGKGEDKEQGKDPLCPDVCSKTLGDRHLPASTNSSPSVLVFSLIEKRLALCDS